MTLADYLKARDAFFASELFLRLKGLLPEEKVVEVLDGGFASADERWIRVDTVGPQFLPVEKPSLSELDP